MCIPNMCIVVYSYDICYIEGERERERERDRAQSWAREGAPDQHRQQELGWHGDGGVRGRWSSEPKKQL